MMTCRCFNGTAVIAAHATAVWAMAAGVLVPLGWAQAAAQPSSAPPNALQGFSQNRDKPVAIESATLEVRDKDKVATFLGNVKLVQGDTTLRCKTLVVFYDQNVTPGAVQATTTTQSGTGGNQQIKRIEAKGNVIVTQKDQTATGENGVFDMASNTVTMTGNVVMTQGVNVVKGDRLWVDMNTGLSRVECKSSECKVQALFQPNAVRDPKADTGNGRDPAKPAAKPAPTSSPLHPSKIY
jgi:lipopolysaccharide export system protein LptA